MRIHARMLLSVLALCGASVAEAQDIETRAARSGRTLPSAYFARIGANPAFFELAAGWRTRTSRAAACSGHQFGLADEAFRWNACDDHHGILLGNLARQADHARAGR